MNRQLQCGTARVLITPPPELLPNLRGLKQVSFGGVVDDLYVRVIALGDGESKSLIISYDLDKAPQPAESFRMIRERCGIPEEHILLFGIHTHSAPITGQRPRERHNNLAAQSPEVRQAMVAYEAYVLAAMHSAVDQAIAAMRPARMGHATGDSFINVNRNQDFVVAQADGGRRVECGLGVNPRGHVDRTLFVMKIEDMDGKPIAFFVNYPVHNVVMIENRCGEGGKLAVSGDIGGTVSQYVESRFPDSVAVWSSGAAGDLNPIMSNQIYYPDPATGKSETLQVQGGELPLAMLKMLSTRHFADILGVIERIGFLTGKAEIRGTVAWSETPAREFVETADGGVEVKTEGVEPHKIRLQLLRVGDVGLFGVGGELFSSLGCMIKEASSIRSTVVVNHVASLVDDAGYIPDDESFAHDKQVDGGAHGVRRSRMLPGTVPPSLLRHTKEMCAEVL